MRLKPFELEILLEGGWRGGWYDIISLDDTNLEKVHAPYDCNTILKYVINSKIISEDLLKRNGNRPETLEKRSYSNYNQTKFEKNIVSLFLGNVFTDIPTIRNTLKIFDDENLSNYFDYCGINKLTRVYQYENPSDIVIENTQTLSDSIETIAYNEMYPSFTYPPLLIKYFGSKTKVNEFFDYIGTTFFTYAYRYDRNWFDFLNSIFLPEEFLSIIKTVLSSQTIISDIEEVNTFLDDLKKNLVMKFVEENFFRKEKISPKLQLTIGLILNNYFFSDNFKDKIDIYIDNLEVGSTIMDLKYVTPYKLMKSLLKRFNSEIEVFDCINDSSSKRNNKNKNDIVKFFKFVFFLKNIKLNPEIKVFFQ